MKNHNYLILLFVLLFSLNINSQQDDQEITAASRKAEKLDEASNSSTIISEKEASDKKSFNILSVLDKTVGVNISRNGVNTFNVSLREGVDIFSTQAVILSDGRELNTYGLNHFDAASSTLSGLDIAKIEVVRGSSSAVYGIGASSGVISFITKNPFEYPGTTVQVTSGGINNSGGSIIAGSAKNVEKNWSLFNINLRHADHNEDKTFGYKINIKYSENNDWLAGENSSAVPNGEIPLMTSFNFDTSLYLKRDNYDITATFGLNDTGNMQRRPIGGEEFKQISSKFFNLQYDSGDFFAQYNYVQNDTSENKAYWYDQRNMGIDSNQSHLQVGYDFGLPSLNTELSAGADHRIIKFDSRQVFGVYEDDNDYRTYGLSVQSKTKLFDNVDVLFQGRYDHFSVLNDGAFSPKGVIIVKGKNEGTLRLSMSQSSIADNAYTLFSDFSMGDFPNGTGYTGPYGNKNALTFNNPTWTGNQIVSQVNANNPLGINFGVLGMDHFSAYIALAPSVIPFATQQFLSTGNSLWIVPLLPGFATLMSSVGSVEYTMFDLNGDLSGSDKSQLSTETTYELGYSNKIGDKFSFSVDLYNIRKQNISSVKRITPTLSLDPSKFGSEFASTFGSALASSYASLGLPSTAYSSILNQYIAVVGQAAAGLATQVPSFGYVNADQTPSDMGRVYWGHYNFGEINYWGTDIATNYDATDNLSFFASYSFLSQTEFSKDDLGEDYNSDENYHLNIPKHRVKGGFSYNPSSGLHLGLSFRYQSSMNINTMNVADGGAFWYDGFVPKRTVWDLSFGIPVSSKTRVDLTVDNVSGKKYQSFVNMPMIGQQALVTLTHSF